VRWFLASLDLSLLGRFLDRTLTSGPLVFVPTAASQLPDRADVEEAVRSPVANLGHPVVDLPLERAVHSDVVRTIGGAGAVVVGGGDPFHLLAATRASGFDAAVVEASRRDVPYVGVSAGAAVAGPSLVPLVGLSPFRPPSGASLDALGLVDQVVVAHREHADRAAEVRRVVREHATHLDVRPLADDEALVGHEAGTELWSASTACTVRQAAARDARGIAETFVEAAHAAWASFLGWLPSVHDVEPDWKARLHGGLPGRLLVAEREERIVGFAWVQPATDDDVPSGHGELSTFYTRPDVWGQGIGRVLMVHALDEIARLGLSAAVLWTEERNERPLAVYHHLGWRPEGSVRERDYFGSPLRELRLTISL
jgi:dipeptidase E